MKMSLPMKPKSVTSCSPGALSLGASSTAAVGRAPQSIRKTLIGRKTLRNLTSCHTRKHFVSLLQITALATDQYSPLNESSMQVA